MARMARGHVPAGTYHVTTRTAGPVPLSLDDLDRRAFCRLLSKMIARFDWRCPAFCLMPTHYHLLIDVAENNLQAGMHQLNGQYAQNFNRRHRRSGHLHGARYHAEPVLTDGHMLYAFRYIARNPLEAELCDSPADWLWSSYRGTAGLDGRFAFVDDAVIRDYFGGDSEEALRLLRNFVERS